VEFEPSAIPEVVLLKPKVFGDERGFFMETYQAQTFGAAGLPLIFLQDNHSGSQRNTLRGLHYQIKQAQGKVIRVVTGEIYDVAVDLRHWSPSFGKWVAYTLSSRNKDELWVPPGFAHGFYVLSDWAEVVYKATDYYAPQYERSLLWNDPALSIPWPILPGQTPIVSTKDAQGSLLAQAEVYTQEIR
jgi:dTDP-4-dehydrorhamnose 3,5-epimerase